MAPERPPRSRWTSFVADPTEPEQRTLHDERNPSHRQAFERLYDAG
ncbi:MAG TPA: hypothetical protein VEF89_26265 [Solirubrobacteraceae bacterium]|nr:hypothetical protein [Solirubrobacteraceae bacterium]